MKSRAKSLTPQELRRYHEVLKAVGGTEAQMNQLNRVPCVKAEPARATPDEPKGAGQ
jgi:hypothetical protein